MKRNILLGFVLIMVIVGSLMLIADSTNKKSNQSVGPAVTGSNPSASPTSQATEQLTVSTYPKQQVPVIKLPTTAPVVKIDSEMIKRIISEKLRSLRPPSSIPISLPTITVPTKAPVVGCTAEGQEKINAYNAQIKQEYDACVTDADAKSRQADECSKQCLAVRSTEYIDCTSKSVNQGADLASCRAEADSRFSACTGSCISMRVGRAICSTTYQEKQRYVVTLMSQYCGLR